MSEPPSGNMYDPGVDAEPPEVNEPSVHGQPARMLAALVSFFLSGLGHAVQGDGRRAAAVLVLVVLGVVLSALLSTWFLVLVGVAWAAAVVDTFRLVPERTYPRLGRALLYGLLFLVLGSGMRAGLRTGVVMSYRQAAAGMAPTLVEEDLFWSWKLGTNPVPGDLVSFWRPDGMSFVKRVVAGPGEVLVIEGGLVSRVGGRGLKHRELPEPCDWPDAQKGCRLVEEIDGERSRTVALIDSQDFDQNCPANTEPADGGCRVADGHVFVMGDNRHNSHDSRAFGSIELGQIGGVVTRLWMRGGMFADSEVR